MKQRFSKERPLVDTLLLFALFVILIFISYRFGQYSSVSSSPVTPLETTSTPTSSSNLIAIDPTEPWIETITWRPRLSLYHNILTNDECDHIITVLRDTLKDSGVRDLKGAFVESPQSEDEVLMKLTQMLGEWTHVPTENGENYYVWRYDVEQGYPSHRDTIVNPELLGGSGERIASVFVFLSTPEGGELSFPDAKPEPVKILPKKGDALLLWNLKPNGEEDEFSTHTVLPITKGTKWTLTKWLRQKKFH
eukprot:TRINITY_DN1277_c0_g2_i3.p1 TRINITY_DN1277_c0_g2~~TRINITY_DN1277_c0_g2_i3.p1  ORF type:complete len:275 (+),score=55.59 TRINITY_DN1277_c0_g2_i3:77-826(+)